MVSFLTDNSVARFYQLYLIAILLLLFLFIKKITFNKENINKNTLLLIIVSISLLIIGQFQSGYSQHYGFISIIFLVILLIYSEIFKKFDLRNISFVYVFSFILISYLIYLSRNDTYIVFSFIKDKNYTAIFIFMFFLYANKMKYISGIMLGFVYCIFFNKSRSFYLMFVLFYLIKFGRYFFPYLYKKIRLNLFYIFISSILIIFIFSFFWCTYISNNVGEYHKTLNDGSNKMRFTSNVYVVKEIFAKRFKDILFYGYGDKGLYNVFGIAGEAWNRVQYNGVRLVVPHNSFIFILLSIGIIPGLIYIFLLSKLLEKYFYDENFEYIIPFLINSLFMHSFLVTKWLLFLVLILSIKSKNKFYFNFNKKI